MLRRILVFCVFAAVAAGVKAWQRSSRSASAGREAMESVNPAMGFMSEATLMENDWSYEGPMGSRTLHFESDGSLTDGQGNGGGQGKWNLMDRMLTFSFPGEDQHMGLFRDSKDELTGLISKDGERLRWSASRIP